MYVSPVYWSLCSGSFLDVMKSCMFTCGVISNSMGLQVGFSEVTVEMLSCGDFTCCLVGDGLDFLGVVYLVRYCCSE